MFDPQVFANTKCMITGGLGFIGSTLAIRLVDLGAHVSLVDSLISKYGGNRFNIATVQQRVHVNIADVRDPHALDYLVQKQDFLFNLAGQTSHVDSMNDPLTDLDINCRAQLSILEACRKNNPDIKIVFASTRQLYGRPERLPVDESHPIRPVDVNGINKFAGEWYHLLYNDVYNLRSVALRLTNTYGPRMRIRDARQTFLGEWIRRILTDQPLLIFGDGHQLRDFNFVDDVVDALLRAAALDTVNGQVLNLGSDEVVSLNTLAHELIRLHGTGSAQHLPFPSERKQIDIGNYYGDWRRAHARLGWSPQTALAEGLARTLAYFSEHKDHYV